MFETIEKVRRGNVPLCVASGHFATNHSHINYYIDITNQKIRLAEAKAVAKELAKHYVNTIVDTILCMDGTTLIGACLAEALTGDSRSVSSADKISVIEPEYNTVGQMVFRDNIQPRVRNKNVLILMASVTTGYTAKRGVSTIAYYGGTVAGIAGLYRAVDVVEGHAVCSIFSMDDLPEYESYDYKDCPFCKAGRKLDALVNSHGYSKL